MYFGLTRRAITIIVDVPDEAAMVEDLHGTWVGARSYPQVWSVGDAAELPALLKRAGGVP